MLILQWNNIVVDYLCEEAPYMYMCVMKWLIHKLEKSEIIRRGRGRIMEARCIYGMLGTYMVN